ncbi:MAG TPA: multidrug effflux MFS transporter [Nocardioides sp.]
MTAARTPAPRWAAAVPVVLAMLAMIGPFSIDTPFPAFPAMERDLGVGSDAMQLVVTTYLAAFAVMSLVHGPVSDAVGRRPVLLWSVAVYVVASIGCTLAPSLPVLLAFRVVQGLSAGGATIVSRTVVRDLYEGDDAQRLMSTVSVIFGLAPAIAPVIGGALLQLGPWPLVFAFQAGLGLLLIARVLAFLPESHPPEARVPFRVGSILRSIALVARRADVHRLAWAGTLNFGALFLYIGGAAIFVHDLLGLGELDYWKFFVPMIGCMMVGSWLSGRLAGRVSVVAVVGFGYAVALGAGVIGVVVGLTPWETTLPWAVLAPSLMGFGNGLAYPVLQLMLLDLAPTRRGAVASFGAASALLFNAVAAVALTPYVAVSTLGLALTALVLLVLGQMSWLWHLRAHRAAGRRVSTPRAG